MKNLKIAIMIIACAFCLLSGFTMAKASGAVTGLKQTDSYTSSFTVEWDAVGGEYYRVLVSTSAGGAYSATSSYPSSSNKAYVYAIGSSSLSAGTSYWVKVETWSNSYNGSLVATSDPIEVVTAPDKVDSSTIKQTGATVDSITVSWTGVAGATGYTVTADSVATSITGTFASVKIGTGKRASVSVVAYKTSGAGFTASSGTSYGSGYKCTLPLNSTDFANTKKNKVKWYSDDNSSILFTWSDNAAGYYVDGYQIQMFSMSGKKLTSKTVSGNAWNLTSKKILKKVKNKGFKVQIRSYKKVDGITLYSSWSKKKTIIPQPSIKGKTSGSTYRLTWAKVANATRYYVYVSKQFTSSTKNKNGTKFKKITVSSKTRSYTISNLPKGKGVNVYVIPVVKSGGKTYKASHTWNYMVYHY